MKKFIFKVLSFFLVLTIALFALKLAASKFHGDERLDAKVSYFLDNQEQYSTLFIGSSLFQCHIIPDEFDACNLNNSSSFNLGMGAMYLFEAERLLDHILPELTNVEEIFFLASEPPDINDKFYHTVKSKYHLNTSNTLTALEYFKTIKNSEERNTRYRYVKSYLENLFSIGEIESMIQSIINNEEEENDFETTKGFRELKAKNEIDQRKLNTHRAMHNNQVAEDDFEAIKLIALFERIQSNCLKKGIKCYFVFHPNSRLRTHLAHLDVIDMGLPNEFPEYYDAKLRADRQGHLNIEGAKIYTKRLCKKYKKLTK